MKLSDKPLRVEATRDGHRETFHDVHVIACDSSGEIIACHGDPGFKTFERSCGKPLQLLTVLTHRPALLDECSLEEIAIMSGSHSAEGKHIETVRGILNRYGLDENLLQCGTHPPVNFTVTRDLILREEKPAPIHNLCSAKHTAMLLACQEMGWSFDDYIVPDHPVQMANRMTFAKYGKLAPDELDCASDGCGVPTWWLDLKSLATAFARFSDPGFGDQIEITSRDRIFEAYHKASWYTAGSGRIGFDFNRESDGNWLGKTGGDGVFAVSIRNKGIGIVLKVIDGRMDMVGPALMHVMVEWGFMSADQLSKLSKFRRTERKNCLGEVVGYVNVADA